jgi:two-component sensor histidine kinase
VPQSDSDTPAERPIVEPAREGQAMPETGHAALMVRIRQQELLAELGVLALQQPAFEELLTRTVHLVAEGLGAEFCKILEYLPQENRLLLRAGVGWDPKLIGIASVGADLESPSGYALRTGRPVISNHLEHEDRFRTPALLAEHGVRRAMNVILQGDGAPFGVLEVDSRSPGEFSRHDLAFLQGAANIVGMALERKRYERELQAALEHHKLLLNEINHRVRNSLQLVIGQLTLQARDSDDPALTRGLHEAISRVAAVARVHERLYRSGDILNVDLAAYLSDVCEGLSELMPQIEFQRDDRLIRTSTDRAVSVALLATELLTNATKHAQTRIVISLAAKDASTAVLSVRDEGAGLPEDFAIEHGKGLGMRIIAALIRQLHADLNIIRHDPGSEFVLTFPLTDGPAAAAVPGPAPTEARGIDKR